MKTILQLKLNPSDDQKSILIETMLVFNAACDHISEIAWNEQCFSKFKLHKIVYYPIKEQFKLTAQMVIRAIGKVVDSYKTHRECKHIFKSTGAVIYDQRIMAFRSINKVNLWTVNGRETISFVFGQYQKKRWHQRKGQAQLILRDKTFYLLVSVETEEGMPIDPEGYIGVDLGIVEIATCSDGESYFHRDVNHCISKKIVEKAKRSGCSIILEDLKNIRSRMKARKSQRSRMHSWSFFQLRRFITYKSKLAGIPVIVINPKNTSRRCSACGHTEKANRKSQSEFVCHACGFMCNADYNASLNISFIGSVNSRIVGSDGSKSLLSNCAAA